ncbi:MAG: hypothetical protein ACYS0D_08055 [Planctomycetota bacterium]|jgi:hypothetical protein
MLTNDHFAMSWHNQTTLHPLGLVAIVILGLFTLFVPRRWALAPMLIMACFIAPAQRIAVLEFDFNLMRIMVLFGLARLFLNNEIREFVWKPIDTVVMAWAIVGTLAAIIYHSTWAIVVYRLGVMFDVFGMYFLTRCLVRDWDDIAAVAKIAALVAIPVAVVFVYEKATGHNMFHVFGGVPEFTVFRGIRRCQGAFAHPILAGCFWAALAAIIAPLWWRSHRDRYLGPVGVLAAFTIIFCSGSSTPVWSVIVGVMAFFLLPFRNWLWLARVGAACAVVMLHLVMNNPVWHLLSRLDLFGSSQGWYRFKVIDEFIRHFDQWWLVGTDQYANWFEWGLADLTNQYVLEGVRGGLLTLVLFVTLIWLGFQGMGRALRHLASDRPRMMLTWGLGVSLADRHALVHDAGHDRKHHTVGGSQPRAPCHPAGQSAAARARGRRRDRVPAQHGRPSSLTSAARRASP